MWMQLQVPQTWSPEQSREIYDIKLYNLIPI